MGTRPRIRAALGPLMSLMMLAALLLALTLLAVMAEPASGEIPGIRAEAEPHDHDVHHEAHRQVDVAPTTIQRVTNQR